MLEIPTYHKIPGPFRREISGPNKNKVIPWAWISPELEFLAGVNWRFTEKVDGTNIRVIWDGHRPEFRGRTDKAQLPAKLVTALTEMFPEELFEQTFGEQEVVLFGEGYGAGIQKGGGNYRKDNSFILFDVYINGWWLNHESVVDIANSLGVERVPLAYYGTLIDAIEAMSHYEVYSQIAEVPNTLSEGWVGTPAVPLYSRKGERLIVKLKARDLRGLDLTQTSNEGKLGT